MRNLTMIEYINFKKTPITHSSFDIILDVNAIQLMFLVRLAFILLRGRKPTEFIERMMYVIKKRKERDYMFYNEKLVENVLLYGKKNRRPDGTIHLYILLYKTI